jgi:DNA-binding response OmpR family regulator
MPHPKSQILPGLRVLVVEDDLLIAMDLEATLEDFGCTVVGPCERLDKALQAAERDVDAAIVDMNLRGEHSFPVIERLRARRVPTIVCSGYVDLPDIQERLAGIPMLPKPCSPTRLLGMLEDLIERNGLLPQPAAN